MLRGGRGMRRDDPERPDPEEGRRGRKECIENNGFMPVEGGAPHQGGQRDDTTIRSDHEDRDPCDSRRICA
jgi:hypothetical protein